MSRCRTLCVGLLLAVFALPVATADARRITFGERDLRQGMRGTDVRVLQDFLTKAGIKTTVDGQYGPGTTSRVRRWERKSSLPVDGRDDARGRRDAARPGRAGRLGAAEHGRRAARRRADRRTPRWGPTGWRSRRRARRPRSSAVIAAANEIVGKPYKYGGGHGDWDDSGYDCSGSESYALHGAGLVSRAAELDGVHVVGRGGPGSVDHELRQQRALLPRGRRPAIRHRLQRRAAAARSGAREMRPSDGYTVRHPAGL